MLFFFVRIFCSSSCLTQLVHMTRMFKLVERNNNTIVLLLCFYRVIINVSNIYLARRNDASKKKRTATYDVRNVDNNSV
jgi:fucose 4-O-acetylase-like acetyltransferase